MRSRPGIPWRRDLAFWLTPGRRPTTTQAAGEASRTPVLKAEWWPHPGYFEGSGEAMAMAPDPRTAKQRFFDELARVAREPLPKPSPKAAARIRGIVRSQALKRGDVLDHIPEPWS